ncbi:Pentatricopeptide repeat-containing protein [Thalictrum thalictroides]|uniref:Pentatricopeptide repeat-containing protein n=1 Tax=Thalictrum thalictroides TaxID=46969 RepID=A0A7J6X2L8_THATH|nr:Pentatricopeptide repeat-containing protein [Thalictrum thalictroides]
MANNSDPPYQITTNYFSDKTTSYLFPSKEVANQMADFFEDFGAGSRHHLQLFFESRKNGKYPTSEFALVSVIKSCTSHLKINRGGEEIHCFVMKSGYDSNIYVQNSLINYYVKRGYIDEARLMFDYCLKLDTASWNIMVAGYVKLSRLEDAWSLFEVMSERDCVSFTTMIMGLVKDDKWVEALEIFKEMKAVGVNPNEVTLGTLISACSQLGGSHNGDMLHTVAVKSGLEVFILVSTNLIHMYCNSLRLADAKILFDMMPERNEVTWNVMLNGFAKMGLVDYARNLFDRIPVRDLVSWSTMIDGYVRADRLDEALGIYRKMVFDGLAPNEVTIVDLVSACGRLIAIDEGQQLHCMTIKTGLECFVFLQATLIHFYATCTKMDQACLQFEVCCKDNISSWNALIAGFVRNKMVDSARQVFNAMPERDVISWSSMIAGYAQIGQSESTLELFHEMLSRGIQPNEITMVSILSSIANSGTLDQGRWLHGYIHNNSIPLNDNLSAGLIDMYAKRGSINGALELFKRVQDRTTSISPWNTIICGLAIHGHVDMSLRIFSDLQRTNIRPNSITFIGVLSACCHAGLLEQGQRYFDCMKRVYKIEPNIKHFGCMVDLLGRSGRLAEAEGLIMGMPMKADVVIWGTLLAASKTHGDLKIGERAAKNLAQLEPAHGAGRVLLSNLYADLGRWDDVFVTRRLFQSQGLKKSPGSSGVM